MQEEAARGGHLENAGHAVSDAGAAAVRSELETLLALAHRPADQCAHALRDVAHGGNDRRQHILVILLVHCRDPVHQPYNELLPRQFFP